MVVLDTSVIIDHLRQHPNRESHLDKTVKRIPEESFAVALITIQELYIGASTRDDRAEQLLLTTVGSLRILAYTYEIAELAGKIARDSARPIEFADAAIAATAIINGGRLVSLNKKDFTGIGDLELFDF